MLIQTLALSLLPFSPVASSPVAPVSEAVPVALLDDDWLDDEWLDLDEEIEAITESLAPGLPGVISGRLIGSYAFTNEPFFFYGNDGGGEHVSGVQVRSARLRFEGGNEQWSWLISADAGGRTIDNEELTLRTARVTRHLSDLTGVTIGRFKHPITQAGMISSKYRMFFDREQNGEQTNDRELGLKLEGDYGQFHAFLSAMNSPDGVEPDMILTGRLEYDLMGEPFDRYEGAYRAPEGTHLGLAVAGVDDGTLTDGTYTAFEAELTSGGFFVGGSMVSYSEEYDEVGGLSQDNDLHELLGTPLANTTPFSVTSSFLFDDSRYEIAGRIEVFDDQMETTRTSFSFSIYHPTLGPRARILFDYSDIGSDDDAVEGNKLEMGFFLLLNE